MHNCIITFRGQWLLLILLFIAACAGDPLGVETPTPAPGPNPAETRTIREVIEEATPFQPVAPRVTADSLDAAAEFNQDVEAPGQTQRYFCTTRRVRISGGNSEFPLFNPNSSVIYPGNLLQGKTLADAPPRTIPLARGPGVISYNLINGNFAPSVAVDSVVLSEVRRAQNEIIAQSVAQNGPSVPANFSLSVEQVQSREELAFRLGASVKTLNVAASGNLSVANQTNSNTVLVTLKQAYYTMDVDVPTTAEGFFRPGITGDELARYVSSDNPAAYISSVTYGRVFHMVFTSTSSASQMKANLNLAFKTFKTEANGSVEASRISDLDNLSVQVLAYGGADAETFNAVADFTEKESIRDFLRQIGQASDIRTGLPLSYVVNSVADPSRVLRVNLATEYDITECELKGVLPPAGYAPLRDLFRNENDPGGLGAMVQVNNGQLLVFNARGDRYAWFDLKNVKIEGVWDLKDEAGPLGGSAFDRIGGAVRYRWADLILYDETGLRFQVLRYGANNVPSVGNNIPETLPIGRYLTHDNGTAVQVTVAEFDRNTPFPFSNDGISAATNWRPENSSNIYWNGRGDRYAAFNSHTKTWGNVGETHSLFVPNGGNFDRVSAAVRFFIGGSNARYLFVNQAGDEIVEFNTRTNSYQGPWVIN